MKYTLALVGLAASAFAAPALTPREPQRGNHHNQGQDNQPAATAPAATSIASAQVAGTPAASQVVANAAVSQAAANPISASSAAVPTGGATTSTGGTIPDNLIPDFGVTAGIPDPNQAGSCLGLNNAAIPCFCPPARDAFISRLNEIVAAGGAFGHPAQFPTDDSTASQAARLNALTVTMQNFNGTASGVGCPKAAANFG